MDSLFAIKGKDFVVIAADKYTAYSIMRLTVTF
jgi:20S proteasome alpha/beta subunit